MAEPYPAWACLLTIVVAVDIATSNPITETRIRISGLALQFLGIGTVAYGIRDTRKRFRHEGVVEKALQWLRRFPRWRQHHILMAGSGALGIASSSGRANVWGSVDPSVSTQEQLNAVHANVERLKVRIGAFEAEFDLAQRHIAEAIRKEEVDRNNADRELREQSERAHTGGLTIGLIELAPI